MPTKFASKPGRDERAKKSQKRREHFKKVDAKHRGRKSRAPGLDDHESPFYPVPGFSSAGEY